MRRITSLTLVIASFVELVTSVVLYIIPSGRVAYWSDYHLLGLDKHQWGNIHITVGTLLIIAIAIHIYNNWHPIVVYLKNKSKQLTIFNKNFNIALAITLYVSVGTLYTLPPMNYILDFGEYVTNLGNKKYGEPPYGHAELSSLNMFCSKMNINLEKAIELLQEAGIKIAGPHEPIGEIAKNNGKTAQMIYDLIKQASINKDDEASVFPESPPPGFGNQTIEIICQTYKLDTNDVISKLKLVGFSININDTVKEVAANNNSNPIAIFEMLNDIAHNSE